MLKAGVYEQVINRALQEKLSEIEAERKSLAPIDEAEASQVLSHYLTDIVQKGMDTVSDNGGDVSSQVDLANRIVNIIRLETGEDEFSEMNIAKEAEQLLAILKENDPMLALGKTAKDVVRPETSLAESSLFTGAVHEPQMVSELKKEIHSTDEICMLVSFIKWSGLRLIWDELEEFTKNGGKLAVITTSYMGATDLKAIKELNKLPNTKIKVSYDTKRTRLHAKAYVFYRETGFTTAYVGSSNLSNAAISSGLEWNLKITAKDLPHTIQKIFASFESYWNSDEFEFYKEGSEKRLAEALNAEKRGGDSSLPFAFDIRPYPFQQEILDKLQAEREVRGKFRNLIVAATGTGKTVISAFDYRRFCAAHPQSRNRLLFVAHREEILKQSLAVFQGILKDPNFGELFVGNYKPSSLDAVFISVQTLNSRNLCESLPADYYDYIIVDEFHHACAPTYQKLLSHFQPKILLGLTATPERRDGEDILRYFGGRIAAEIRLPEAVDRKLLCPFQYFGVSDTVDLDELHWVRGGYDIQELTKVYCLETELAKRRVEQILRSLEKYVTEIDDVKGLGFCVSVKHAEFMAEQFNAAGIPSISLTGSSSEEERNTAGARLVSGELRFIFVIDLYNEGVDIPEVNTVLFLRPTESLTVFLQQLGRGLRLSEGKDCLTVLDFVGLANRNYDFEEKLGALLTHTRGPVIQEIKNGFLSVPKGCFIHLEKKAERAILQNIKARLGSRAALISRISDFEADSGKPLTLRNFLHYYHMDVQTLYDKKRSFSRLCVLADKKEDFSEPAEEKLTKALPKLAQMDSAEWMDFLLKLFPMLDDTDFEQLSPHEKRLLRMFYVTIWGVVPESFSDEEVLGNLYSLSDSPVMLGELTELLEERRDSIDLVAKKAALPFDCPLDVHCTYTRDQILAAMDHKNPSAVREGVKWFSEKKTDLFFITLNKSDREYSPTTMYRDYSINERLFHWQSQSTTSETSPTGQRYIHHRAKGSSILLFVREYKQKGGEACPYTFLGKAEYVKHTGSRPMNITWRLAEPIPAKYLKKTNKLAAN